MKSLLTSIAPALAALALIAVMVAVSGVPTMLANGRLPRSIQPQSPTAHKTLGLPPGLLTPSQEELASCFNILVEAQSDLLGQAGHEETDSEAIREAVSRYRAAVLAMRSRVNDLKERFGPETARELVEQAIDTDAACAPVRPDELDHWW